MDGITSRPLDFSEVIGQTKAKELIVNSLATGKINRAYLFPGPHGIGKTTLATLFSRGLLCQNRDPVSQSPCNECASCKNFLRNANSSYTEIDAANHGSKEDMSNLLDSLNYDFDSGNRVILFDEAHAISKSGKDALLRILERPVSEDGTIFMMCTTEIDSMPKTLRSRCVVVPMRKPSNKEVLDKLVRICNSMGAHYEHSAMVSLAEWSGGHFRDAENALNPLLLMGGINVQNVALYTAYDPDTVANLLLALSTDLSEALNISDDICARFGADTVVSSIVRLLLEAIRYGLSGMALEVSEGCKKVYNTYGSKMGNLLQHFTAKGRMSDQRLLQAELIQVHYKFLKGDMDFGAGKAVHTPATHAASTTQTQPSTGSKFIDQRKMKVQARGTGITPDTLQENVSKQWGQEETSNTLKLPRRC